MLQDSERLLGLSPLYADDRELPELGRECGFGHEAKLSSRSSRLHAPFSLAFGHDRRP